MADENRKQLEKKPKVQDSNKLPSVPESVLKRRKRRETAKATRLQTSIKRRTQHFKKKHTFKRAEQFIKEHRLKERDETRLVREARKLGNHYIPKSQNNLAFVIRIRAVKEVCPKVEKIFKLFRLKKLNSGMFVKLNEATINMLRIIEPYVTWGYPNLKSVRELVFKRGFAKVDKKRVPITSNAIVENALGSKNIICTEDLIHEIFTVGPKFKYASNFFWPFKLNAPNNGWNKRTTHFNHGGDYGNRGDKINELLRRMV